MSWRSSTATVVLFQALTTVATPNNGTITSGWVADPDGRGTFTILSSCVLTLSLCVYTAIHLNVRPSGQTEVQAWIETTKWVVLGVLGPELLVFVAWRQYMSAMALDRTVRRVKKGNQKSNEKPAQGTGETARVPNYFANYDCLSNPWSRVHSFYANMGGFVIDLEDVCQVEDTRFTSKISRLTLTPRGVALLAQCGYLPKITKEDILDKNKSDNVSRILSVLQALWMLAQIVGRLISKMPVTLLEVNTLAHIVCAIIIYLLWWDKPKLINEPTKISGDWVPSVGAYMFMSSQISGWKRIKPGILKKDWIDPELSILTFERVSRPTPVENTGGVLASGGFDSTQLGSARSRDSSSRTVFDSKNISTDSGMLKPRPILALKPTRVSTEIVASSLDSRLQLSQEYRANRWALAAEAMTLHSAIASRVAPREIVEDGKKHIWLQPATEELVDDYIGNWATGNLLRDMSGFIMGMVLWSASMVYGGVHATAWHGFFPSKIEAILWRASSVCIAGSGLTWILINMLAKSSKHFKAYWKAVETLRADWISLVSLGTLATLCGLAYMLARVFLVIEAFISLRKLPAAAFDTLQWTQLVPHL